ncbi:Dwil\GK21198-PA-like protein [Anopheles sinensis]|uniref:Dwil\GK21198-PA-like protein n=1 Tax=Anopheles sinensis TaxID=74873 RepID=A0A084WAS8_ANOSI|nr:Dwil\GK21198-PA-like protein [Anopheles sinensis]
MLNARAGVAIQRIQQWMSSVQLQLVLQKTELVAFHSQHSSLHELAKISAKKAVSVFQSLNRIISNRRAPRSSIKRIFVSVMENIFRNGTPVTCAFSNVSYDAECVIAGVVSIHLVIHEDARCYEHRREMKAETMTIWQEQWNAAEHGHYTRECIPHITRSSRKHGEVNRHHTQILSGFGFLRAYQHRVGNAESPTCPTEREAEDDVLRIYPRFDEERRPLRRADGSYPTLRELCDDMCASEVVWQAACSTTRNIKTRLQQSWNRETPMPSRRRQ